jgi:4'-phosphopantetheinyl transferase
MHRVYVTELTETVNLSNYIKFASDYKQANLLRKPNFATSLVGDLLVRFLLNKQARTNIIKSGFRGKPQLVFGALEFNLAHSGNLVACVFDSFPIGIDVEKIKLVKRADALAERFFAPLEIEILHEVAQPLKSRWFLQFWTFKESFFKKCNKLLDLNSISFAGKQANLKFKMFAFGEFYYFEQLEYEEYLITVCSNGVKNCVVEKVEIETLLDFWWEQGGN